MGGRITASSSGHAALYFNFTTEDLDAYNQASAALAAADPAGGSFTFNGETYTWADFDVLVNQINLPGHEEAQVSIQTLGFGINQLYFGRLHVIVPATAIPNGYGECYIRAEALDGSGEYGFQLDATVWDVSIVCDGVELSNLEQAITVCIRPADGVTGDKHVFHRHGSSSFFSQLPDIAAAGDYVCGTTSQLSLFTLGQDSLPATGFAPGVVTELPHQPVEAAYAQTELLLNIPQLGINAAIVGVPQGAGGWDVRWLGEDAGFLEGTAFPTTAGNTVITAHVWDADNSAGLFAGIYRLEYGERFSIVYGGTRYTYEVRSNDLMSPASSAPLAHEDLDWVTLITCQGFDPDTGLYRFRRVVRAVLVAVD